MKFQETEENKFVKEKLNKMTGINPQCYKLNPSFNNNNNKCSEPHLKSNNKSHKLTLIIVPFHIWFRLHKNNEINILVQQ